MTLNERVTPTYLKDECSISLGLHLLAELLGGRTAGLAVESIHNKTDTGEWLATIIVLKNSFNVLFPAYVARWYLLCEELDTELSFFIIIMNVVDSGMPSLAGLD